MKAFFKTWCDFLKAIVDPWIFTIIALYVYLTIQINNTENQNIITLLTILISISSAVIGSILAKNLLIINGEDSLRARGKVSIRSLKLILGNLYSFSKSLETKGSNKDIKEIYLSDIIERITILQEEVLSSIENWTDIIPEADVKTQIGIITSLKEDFTKNKNELELVISELNSRVKKTSEEKQELKDKVENIKSILDETQKSIYEKSSLLFGSTGSILTTSGFINNGIDIPDISITPNPLHFKRPKNDNE